MTALPRLAAAARRALHADGLTTLEDVVDAGRHHVAGLPGVDPDSMARLDAAVQAAGRADADTAPAARPGRARRREVLARTA